MVHHQRFETREEAEAAIQKYIEIFYNRQRLHSRLGYVSPTAFEANYYMLSARTSITNFCTDPEKVIDQSHFCIVYNEDIVVECNFSKQ